MCDDLYFIVQNTGGFNSGVIGAVMTFNTDNLIQPRVGRGSDLKGTVKYNMTDFWIFTDPDYDFSGWNPVVGQAA